MDYVKTRIIPKLNNPATRLGIEEEPETVQEQGVATEEDSDGLPF